MICYSGVCFVEAVHQVREDAFAMALAVFRGSRTSVPKIASGVPIRMAFGAAEETAERALFLAVSFVDIAAAIAKLACVGRVNLDQGNAEPFFEIFELSLEAALAEFPNQPVQPPAKRWRSKIE